LIEEFATKKGKKPWPLAAADGQQNTEQPTKNRWPKWTMAWRGDANGGELGGG